MINYLIQVVLFQALFLAVYDLFLQKETFFKWNRVYLLVTPLLSFAIPYLKVERFQKAIPPQYVEQLPEVFINPQVVIQSTASTITETSITSVIYYVGMLVFLLFFLVRLSKIINLINSNTVIKESDYKLVLLQNKQSAFSFFKMRSMVSLISGLLGAIHKLRKSRSV